MTSGLTPAAFDELHEFIRVQVWAGYAPVDQIVEEAVEVFAESARDLATLRKAAQVVADQTIAAHRAEQMTWPATTDCDRLDAAFAELELSGIVARQHFSCCGTCGAHEIHDEMELRRKAGLPTRGFTFFHMQDTEHAIAGDSLYLSYGSVDRDREASIAIGHEVVAALVRHGLSPAWNGKLAHRIALPLVWQRRR